MPLSSHTIKPNDKAHRDKKRVGRGNASQKGTTAGRGTKGQKARTGGRGGLKLKGLRSSLLKVPKLRGFKSHFERPETITLSTLDRVYAAGATVTPRQLCADKLISTVKKGVKILATGNLTKALTIEGCVASKAAAIAVEKAGGRLVY